MNNSSLMIEDILENPKFVDWVLNPNQMTRQEWEEWLARNPQDQDKIDLARKIVLSLKVEETSLSESFIKENLKDFKHKVGIREENTAKVVPMWSSKWIKWSAAAVLLLVAGIQFFSTQKTEESAVVSASEWIVKTNPKGQKLIVSLEDGSTVKLNAESTIRYSTDFRNSRIVELEGEAFFEVKRDAEQPFVVRSQNLETTVLGTSFNVRSYPEEPMSRVVVASGKVLVATKDKDEKVILTKAQMTLHTAVNGLAEAGEADMRKELAWKDNVLVFENASFDKIEQELTRWFNVHFEYDKRPVINSFNGEFKNQSLENILQGIRFATGLEYKLEKQKVVILN
ncbi:MAG: FecR domain-containing protein [Cyclobacteriaceae bacterium]